MYIGRADDQTERERGHKAIEEAKKKAGGSLTESQKTELVKQTSNLSPTAKAQIGHELYYQPQNYVSRSSAKRNVEVKYTRDNKQILGRISEKTIVPKGAKANINANIRRTKEILEEEVKQLRSKEKERRLKEFEKRTGRNDLTMKTQKLELKTALLGTSPQPPDWLYKLAEEDFKQNPYTYSVKYENINGVDYTFTRGETKTIIDPNPLAPTMNEFKEDYPVFYNTDKIKPTIQLGGAFKGGSLDWETEDKRSDIRGTIETKTRGNILEPIADVGLGVTFGMAGGIKTLAHPIKSAKNLYYAVTHPYEVGDAFREHLEAKGLFFVAGEIGGALLIGKGIKETAKAIYDPLKLKYDRYKGEKFIQTNLPKGNYQFSTEQIGIPTQKGIQTQLIPSDYKSPALTEQMPLELAKGYNKGTGLNEYLGQYIETPTGKIEIINVNKLPVGEQTQLISDITGTSFFKTSSGGYSDFTSKIDFDITPKESLLSKLFKSKKGQLLTSGESVFKPFETIADYEEMWGTSKLSTDYKSSFKSITTPLIEANKGGIIPIFDLALTSKTTKESTAIIEKKKINTLKYEAIVKPKIELISEKEAVLELVAEKTATFTGQVPRSREKAISIQIPKLSTLQATKQIAITEEINTPSPIMNFPKVKQPPKKPPKTTIYELPRIYEKRPKSIIMIPRRRTTRKTKLNIIPLADPLSLTRTASLNLSLGKGGIAHHLKPTKKVKKKFLRGLRGGGLFFPTAEMGLGSIKKQAKNKFGGLI